MTDEITLDGEGDLLMRTSSPFLKQIVMSSKGTSPVPVATSRTPSPKVMSEKSELLEDTKELTEEESRVTENSVSADHVCQKCDEAFINPKVLSCLHVFCETCLQQLEADNKEEDDESRDVITCPDCSQETRLDGKGVQRLIPDFVVCNMMDMVAIEKRQISCTSCKAKEKAVARCSDCANFLCPNCVTAHQYMRCFENHKVVSFDEIKNSGNSLTIHKPLFCQIHAGESMKYYCNTCLVPICNECIVTEHKQPDHVYERVADCEKKQIDEIHTLIAESKCKIRFCEEASAGLENSLSELQLQHDNAKGLINETFQTYKTMLEKNRDEMLNKLADINSSQRLAVMEMCHTIDKTVEKMDHGCSFTEKLLKYGNLIEILSLKKLIVKQLLYQINNTPKPEVNIQIKFTTDPEKFEQAVKELFGTFEENDEKPLPNSHPQVHSPTSMHSSFDSDVFSLAGVISPKQGTRVIAPDFTTMPPPMPVPPMMQPDRSLSRNSHSPTMSDSVSSDLGNGHITSLQELSKLGNVNINSQGLITINGQVIPGLTVNNVSGLSQLGVSAGGTSLGFPAQSQAPLGLPPSADILNLLNTASALNTSTGLTGTGSLMSSGKSSPLDQINTLTNMDMNILNLNNTSMANFLSQPSPGYPGGNFNGPGGMNPSVPIRATSGKLNTMQIRCKFGQLGPGKTQFNSPHGFCLGADEDIIVADTNNHRVQVFEKTGEFKYQFGIPGREEGQLWYPRKVAVIRSSGKFVVCDRGNERSRMQIFTKNGHFIKKIAIRYIDIVAGLAITHQGHIVAVDSVSPTVFRISEVGDLLKWFDCSDYMREPSDIAISGKEYYVCDFKGHCVVVFDEDGHFLRRIGCENITCFPNGIDISDAGDVLVGDSHGNRFHVAVFHRDGSILSEFECPYVKVSRCCGLKITSEGYIVTLAKNNHHVLVLNTLYIM